MEFLELLSRLRTPLLDKMFLLITELGGEMAFIAVAVVVFWCFSKKDGYLLMTIGFVGMVANQFLKLSFRVLRPWVKNPDFKAVGAAIPDAGGFSFPSGHTQNSVGLYGTLATVSKSSLTRAIFLVLCLVVPFSRLYLGVHTPIDVGFSFFFAIFLICVFKPIFERIYKNTAHMMSFLFLLCALAILFVIYVQFIFDPSTLSSDQVENYVSALKNAYLILGAIVGVLIALPIERHFIKFSESGKWYTQVLKSAVGLVLVLVLLEGLKLPLNYILPENTLARALRYGLVVLFAISIYPLSFKWFKLLENSIEMSRKIRKIKKQQ